VIEHKFQAGWEIKIEGRWQRKGGVIKDLESQVRQIRRCIDAMSSEHTSGYNFSGKDVGGWSAEDGYGRSRPGVSVEGCKWVKALRSLSFMQGLKTPTIWHSWRVHRRTEAR
jgi:hypothetical protein